jgi:hypothetical protein
MSPRTLKNAGLVLATVLAALAVGLLWSRGCGPAPEPAAAPPTVAAPDDGNELDDALAGPELDAGLDPGRDPVRRVHPPEEPPLGATAPRPAPEPGTGALRIVLVDQDGAPVDGGTCLLLRQLPWMDEVPPGTRPSLQLETDASGTVDAAVEPGKWRIETHAADLVGRPVHVEIADGDEREVTVEMDAATEVCGRVVDRDTGLGIEGALVWCPTRSVSLVATTDADGGYRLPHVTAQLGYGLRAVAQGYGTNMRYCTSPARCGCEEHALDIELLAGKTVRGDLPASVDASRTRIEAFGYFPSGTGIRTRDGTVVRAGDDGSFTVEDLRGDIEHELLVEAPGHARFIEVVPARPGLVDVGRVDLQREAVLSGTVSAADGERVADVIVRLMQLDVPSRLFGADPVEVRTGPDGAWRVDGLPAGRWRVDVLGGGAPLASDEVALVAGDTQRNLVLREAAPCVRGRVTGEEPGELSLLVDIGTFSRRIPIAADGRFVAHGVPHANNVLLHVQRADGTGAWRDHSFVRASDLVPGEDVLIRLD